MKKLLLFFVLMSFNYAITIKLIDETDTSKIDLDKLYSNYANKNNLSDDTHIGKVATFDLNDKSSNKFFIGAFYGLNLSGTSTLKNSEDEKVGSYSAQPLGWNIGLSMKSADLYLNFGYIGTSTDAIPEGSYGILGGGFRYKMMITQVLYPFIAIEAGYADTLDEDDNTVAGVSMLAGAGIGLDIAMLSLKLSYTYTNILWDYPVSGVTNTYTEQSILADASVKF